ncbi:MAG: hypothetical protein ACI4XA_07320 [Oscillospiraceae bacterium]
MKKTAALLLGIFLLTGCSENAPEAAALSDEFDDFIAYDISDIPGCFTIADDGTMYLFTYTYSDSGTIDNIRLNSYNMDGRSAVIGEYDKPPVCMDMSEGLLYCVYSEAEHYSICSLDFEKQEKEELFRIEGYSSIKRIDVSGNDIYFLGTSGEPAPLGEYTDIFGIYSYGGEKLLKIDLSTGETTASEVPFPITYSMYGGECTVYAADKDGYYFSDFGNSGKKYHNIEQLYGFDMYARDKYLFSSGSGINIGMLCAGTTDPNGGISQVLDGYYIDGDIRSVGGYTFFTAYNSDTAEKNICRIKNSSYIKKNSKIRLISTEYCFDEPFGCGYTIDYRSLPADSFALAVLSQDSSYDISIVNSYESFSSNLRDKGSFCPLNDIPNVREYLDNCFPYIKEAATDENGDIWMLPVSVNMPMIAYNQKTCAEVGIDFTEKMTIEEFVKVCEKAHNSEYADGYDVQPYRLTQNLLIQYMANHETFDTAVFRGFAEFAEKKVNISDISEYPSYLPPNNDALNNLYRDGGEKRFLFSCQWDNSAALWLSQFEDFRFAAVPPIDAGDKISAACAFIAVNPASGNLEAALDYISSLAEYLSESRDTFMLSDKNSYTMNGGAESLYELYAAAEIGFNVSEEICFDTYKQYQRGDITLDELIAEADRKLSAYMKE